MVKVAEKAYYNFKRPVSYYLSYIKLYEDELIEQKESTIFEQANLRYYQDRLEEIQKLGICTYSLVLIWAGFKNLAKLCQRVASHSPQVVNYVYDDSKEDKHRKFLID